MPSPSRAPRGVLALILACWTQACYSYRPAPPGAAISPASIVRVQAEAPFALRAPFLAGEGEVLCHTRLAEGRLRQLAGDTLSLELVGRLISVPGPDRVERVCPANGTVWMVRTAATSVEVSEADTGRTVVVLLVAAVIVLGFAAFAASQIPVGAPSL